MSNRNGLNYKSNPLLPGELLQMYRQRTGLTQQRMARLLGLQSARVVQYWESGDSLPKAENLKKVIELYLNHQAFINGQEKREARHLWEVIKSAIESKYEGTAFNSYPVLDESWLEQLLQAGKPRGSKSGSRRKSGLLVLPGAANSTLPDKTPRKGNLPSQSTSFVGRKQELSDILQLLKETRLVTLTGIGGIGKTRLALKVTESSAERFEDGVWVVELAETNHPRQLLRAVAQTLGLEEQQQYSLSQTLLEYLHSRRLLLVLDNCEHLIQDCAQLTDQLLRSCPNLTILTTSREWLGIGGERVYRILPLTNPEPDAYIEAAELSRYDSIQLLLERMAQVQPDFTLTPSVTSVVTEICQRLEGIPLALELAAARINTLSLEQIVAQLHNRFRLLVSRSRTALPRHITLRATIDWSYALLAEAEQLLLRRLAVFAGGWSLEGVEEICSGAGLEREQVLNLLQQLANKSLVVAEQATFQQPEARYHLLDTIREYALEKLVEAGEQEWLEQKYAAYYLKLVQEAERDLRGPELTRWLPRLEAEYSNLEATLHWCTQEVHRLNEIGLPLAAALWWFWFIRSYISEGERWLVEAMLPHVEAASPLVQINILDGAGSMFFLRGNFEKAIELTTKALNISREVGNNWETAFALGALAMQYIYLGELAKALELTGESLPLAYQTGHKWLIADEALIEGIALVYCSNFAGAMERLNECLRLGREIGNGQVIAHALFFLGLIEAGQNRLPQAFARFEESLNFSRQLRDSRLICDALNEMAVVASRLGRPEQAETLLLESLSLSETHGNRTAIATSCHSLGWLALEQGEIAGCRNWLNRSLDLFVKIRDKKGLASVIESVAELAGMEGYPDQAAQLFGAAAALRFQINAPLPPVIAAEVESRLAYLRSELGEEAFEQFWEKGGRLDLARLTYAAHALLN